MSDIKKPRKKLTLIQKVVMAITIPALIFALVYSGSMLFKELKITKDLNKDLAKTEETIARLNQELESLQNEKEKLTDPNYVNAVARSKYNLTKVGEEVYSLETLED